MTASALPSRLKALLKRLWPPNAREITEPLFRREHAGTWRTHDPSTEALAKVDVCQPLPEFEPDTTPEKEPKPSEPQAERLAPLKLPELPALRWRGPSFYARMMSRETYGECAKEDEQQRQDSDREPEKEDQERERTAGPTMRSGDAEHMARPNPILCPCPTLAANLLDVFRPAKNRHAIFRQDAWLSTMSNLPSKLRTLWRVTAREITEPRLGHSKRPRKAKAPRPF